MAKENKKSKNPPKDQKTIAEKVQLRLSQLDKKSANISIKIETLQKRLDSANKLKIRIEKLNGELAKVRKAKELELDEISLMCSTYTKITDLKNQEPLTIEAPVKP